MSTRTLAAPPGDPVRRTGLAVELYRTLLSLRRFVERRRMRHPVWESVAGRRLLVLPTVFNPRALRSGAFLAEFVASGVVRPGDRVLDLGTGSGSAAIAAADAATGVVAVDINPDAVVCAAQNAARHALRHVDVRQGDLFGALAADERFDLVLFNPPFYRGEPRDMADAAWRSVDVPERFARGLAAHLTDGGRALVLLSSDADIEGWLRPCRDGGLDVRPVARRDLLNEVLVLYRIAPPGTPARGAVRA